MTRQTMSSTSARALENMSPPPEVPAKSLEAKANVPRIDLTTKLDAGEVGQYYTACALATGANTQRMIIAGSLIYFMSRLFSEAAEKDKPAFSVLDDTLNARLRTSNPNKGVSTLKGWITASRRMYIRLTNNEVMTVGIVTEVRTAATPQLAADAIETYLSKQMVANSDGKMVPCTNSLDLMSAWYMADVTHKNVKTRTTTERVSSAAKSAANTLGKVMTDHHAEIKDVAKELVATITEKDKSAPLALAGAAVARIGMNILALSEIINNTFARLLMDGKFQECEQIIDGLTERLKVQRQNAANMPPASASPTATPEAKAAAVEANTAKAVKPVLPSKPIRKAKAA